MPMVSTAIRDALNVGHMAMTDRATDSPIEVMAPALELHFTESNGVTSPAKRLRPCPAIEIDITIPKPAGFVFDTRTAGPYGLAAHPVTVVRCISACGTTIAVGGRAVIIAAMSNLDKECGSVTKIRDNSRLDLRTVRCGRECKERRRSKGNGSRSRSHDVFHHVFQKTRRTGTDAEIRVHIPLPDK